MSQEYLWTVLLQGGAEVSFRGQGTVQYHDGRQSVWKVRGSREAVDEVVKTAESIGCKVTVYEDSQTAEQETLRLKLLDLGDGYVFQTEKCPTCHWFDPLTETHCGITDWPLETVNASRLLHDKAKTDESGCPLNRLPIDKT